MVAIAKLHSNHPELLRVVSPAVVNVVSGRTEMPKGSHVNVGRFTHRRKAIEAAGVTIHDAQNKVPLPNSLVALVELQVVSNKDVAETGRQRNVHR